MTATAADMEWMAQALKLARLGVGATRPNPPVGAVVVKNGRRVGSGYHRRAGCSHAEVRALRSAGAKTAAATLYVTLEPCSTLGRTPPCTEAIIRSGVRRVVMAVRDPNPKHTGRAAGILRRYGISVTENVCKEEAARLIAPFRKWITTGAPYVTIKLAMSVDGRIGDSTGASRWITGPQARRIVRQLRHECDAVLVGVGTVIADDPSLLPAPDAGNGTVRVVVDSTGRSPERSRIFTDGQAAQTLIATTQRCPTARRRRYEDAGAAVCVVRSKAGRVSLGALMAELGSREVMHVLCEGGGTLADSLIRERLVDEYLFFIAPMLLGDGVPGVAGKGWRLDRCPALEFVELSRIGPDILLRAVPRTE